MIRTGHSPDHEVRILGNVINLRSPGDDRLVTCPSMIQAAPRVAGPTSLDITGPVEPEEAAVAEQEWVNERKQRVRMASLRSVV